MSMIVETPVPIGARVLAKAWWSLQTSAVFVDVVGTNSC